MRKSFDFISECQGRAGEMCPASALLSGRLPQKIRQGKLGFFLFCYYFYLVFGIFLLFLYLRRNISAHCWQQSSELCSQSILQWLKTSWEWGGGSDRRGDLREIQGSHWECQGPGWWWVQSCSCGSLGSTGSWICVLVGISSSLISDLGAELSCQLCFCDEALEQHPCLDCQEISISTAFPGTISVCSQQTVTA